MTTGEKLSSLRKQNNYTQEELADIMNVSRQSVSRWESDIAFPETEKLIALSKLYNCSIDYLLQNDNDERGTCTVVNNKEEVKSSYNKKRLPLVLTTLGTYLALLVTFTTKWFRGDFQQHIKVPVGNGYYYQSTGVTYYLNANFYELFKIEGNPFTNAQAIKIFAIISFAFSASILLTSFIYAFVDAKFFKVIIRVANCAFLVLFAILLLLAHSIGWTASPIIALALVLIQVVVQYAIPQIRKTR